MTKKLGIVTARKRNTPQSAAEIHEAVVHEVAMDVNQRKGPKYHQYALQREGLHVPMQVLLKIA